MNFFCIRRFRKSILLPVGWLVGVLGISSLVKMAAGGGFDTEHRKSPPPSPPLWYCIRGGTRGRQARVP